MIKKLLVASVILVASSNVAFAHVASHKHKHVADLKNEVLVSDVVVAQAPASVGGPYVGASIGGRNQGSLDGIVGNVFAGYGKTFDKAYLGGEVFADVGTISLHGSQYNRSNYGFGASVLPGYMLNANTLAYARAGLVTSRYKGKGNHYQGASQLGAGLQTSLNQNWDVRGEYVYTGSGVFHNFTKTGRNQVNVGLVYKIN